MKESESFKRLFVCSIIVSVLAGLGAAFAIDWILGLGALSGFGLVLGWAARECQKDAEGKGQ
jgi:hypothetical protein